MSARIHSVPRSTLGRSTVLRRCVSLLAALLLLGCATSAPLVDSASRAVGEKPPADASAGPAPELASAGVVSADALSADALTADTLKAEEELFRSPNLNPFARENLDTFRVYRLANGIPFLFKENRSNRLFALRIVVRGHTVFIPPGKAGIEAVTLEMLTKGSIAYPYEEVQRLLFEKSSQLRATAASPDVTAFGLTTLSKYVAELFGLFADSFLHPRWDPQQFAGVLGDLKLKKQRRENDPDSVTVDLLEKRLFAGHPYAALPGGVDDSLSNISLADVVDYYHRMVVPGRLFVVASGDFDADELYHLLDATIGRIPGNAEEVPDPPALGANIRSELVTEPFAESAGLTYVLGGFALPAPDATDYPAVLLMLGMLDDLLYDAVRTQHGAAYSASTGTSALKANYGMISVYKTSVPGAVKPYVDEAIRTLASGRCLAARVESSAAGRSGIGSTPEARQRAASYVPIAEAIQFYKDQYLTAFFTGQATNRSIAAQMALSLIYHGDFRHYLLLTDRLAAVTPRQIVDAVDTYLLRAPILWVAVGPEQELGTIAPDDYRGITAGAAAQ